MSSCDPLRNSLIERRRQIIRKESMGEMEERIFPKFGELMPEIRLMIWKLALPGPRVVELLIKKLENAGLNEYPVIGSSWDSGLFANLRYRQDICKQSPCYGIKPYKQPLPQIQFVCKESHAIAANCYPAFCFRGGIAQTYFDFKHDILYLQGEDYDDMEAMNCILSWMEDREGSGNLLKVENLAIEIQDSPDGLPLIGLEIDIAQTLRLFGGVRKLTLVAGKYWIKDSYGDDLDPINACFLDPINVEETLAIYEKWEPSGVQGEKVPSPIPIPISRVKLDDDVFLRARSESGSPGDDDFPIPEIDYKVAVFGKMKARYDAAKERCQRLLEFQEESSSNQIESSLAGMKD